MNDDGLFAFQKLDVYQASKELARRVEAARIRDAELRDQATRAAKRVFLGLCDLLAIARAVHLTATTLPGWRQLRDWLRDALLWPDLGEHALDPAPAPD